VGAELNVARVGRPGIVDDDVRILMVTRGT
jgi:hypothetical protein